MEFKLLKNRYIHGARNALLWSVILCNLVLILFTTFYPSMDGPSHLYNSNILYHLIKGNEFLKEFYSVNSIFIPNWTIHFIISFFLFFLKPWLAEKAFIILYIVGMFFSFRYLILQINRENIVFSLLIFPFIYSFLFHLGFYNFSFSFIFYFIGLGYWIKNHNSLNIKKIFTLFLLITGAYFSNVLIFGFLGLTIGFHLVVCACNEYLGKKELKRIFMDVKKKTSYLLLASLPGLFFLYLFYLDVIFFPSAEKYSLNGLVTWINDVRPLIVYSYQNEVIITGQFFHLILIFLAFAIFNRKSLLQRTKGEKSLLNIVLLFPVVLSLVLMFVISNGSGAGMMSDRFALMFFMFLIIYVAFVSINSIASKVILIIFMSLHVFLLSRHHFLSIKQLDKDAMAIYEAGKFIKENSIVLPVNVSDNWLQGHFSNYLGCEKSMVILENYEAGMGWFPVKWNTETMPIILLGDNKSINDFEWSNGKNSTKTKQIDYVFIYGNIKKLGDEQWLVLKQNIENNYQLEYKSEDGFANVYIKK